MLALSCLSKKFGGLVVTDQLSLNVNLGEIYALIGPNGAGKTTLIQQISGAIRPDGGRIMLDGQDVTHMPTFERARLGLKRSYQISSLLLDFTVLENVILAAAAQQKIGWRIFRPLLRETIPRNEALSCLVRLGLGDLQNRKLRDLGHGERRQVELAMALAGRSRILLLDEAAAGLSPAETRQVSALLRQLRPDYAILLVEHDMNLVFGVADRIGVLVNGRLIAEDIPQKIAQNPDVRAAYLGDDVIAIAGIS
ncbi:MAG: ABC transporter ATP-binding protein [Alphaproteobacteria bacterium]|nr:ABC transporter ATP-binding protein [Alphaproteobacteria bacterium]